MSYRLKETDDWTTRDNVEYEVESGRFFVLSEELDENATKIDAGKIVNYNQYPADGTKYNLLYL